MKSLIIGGSGMIGSHLTNACKSQGYETISTFFEKIPSSEHQFFLDITDREKTIQLISDQNPDIVFLASFFVIVSVHILCKKLKPSSFFLPLLRGKKFSRRSSRAENFSPWNIGKFLGS